MQTSGHGLKFIENEEWCVLHSYQDSRGKWTIGWGSTMYKSGKRVGPGEKITQEEADDLLIWGVSTRAKVISAFVKNVNLNQNQFDALSSFTYNVGIKALETSTLLKVLKKNPDDPYIRDCFAMWNEITVNEKKMVNPVLVGRRRREADLYFTPIN
jgi:lysozyme